MSNPPPPDPSPLNALPTARLGFGCGNIAGGEAASQSRRIIEMALDEGIDYIDTARLYGEGAAEAVLKPSISSIRSRITLATKAGILPATQTRWRKALGRARRALVHSAPALGEQLPAHWEGFPRFGCFSLRSLKRSLDRSLSELGTDYVDVLLLHECRAADVGAEEVSRFVEHALSSGRIRSWGTAATRDETAAIVAAGYEPPVLQFASGLFDPPVARPSPKPALTVTHGALKPLAGLLRTLEADPTLATAWRAETGCDATDRRSIAALLLREALASNPGGVVLFSSSRPENVSASVRAARDSAPSEAVLAGMRRFAARRDVEAALVRSASGQA